MSDSRVSDSPLTPTRRTLVNRLSRYDRLVEVGIGRRTDVADALAARGREVVATDVVEHDVSQHVRFVCDDVTNPTRAVYANADAVYALNCPPELQAPLRNIAREVGAEPLFTTLGNDPAVIEARVETVADDTLFVAATSSSDRV